MTTVAKFAINYTQYLDPTGKTTEKLPKFANDPNNLIELYKKMVLARTFDTKAINMQRMGQIGTYPSGIGQEALAVGAGDALQSKDVYLHAFREHAILFLRNIEHMTAILAYYGGDERGNDLKTKEDFPVCTSLASHVLHAAGVAKAIQLRKQKRAVLTLFGDGASSEGDIAEALNIAGLWKLPIVFVVNNNQWAISTPRNAQTAAQTIAQKAIAAGFTGEQVDGNDVIAVHEHIDQALKRARTNQGPTLIEAITYRLDSHTTADDPTRYRSDKEVEQAKQNDPIKRLKHYLEEIKCWDAKQEKMWQQSCKETVNQAAEAYLAMPPQKPTEIFEHLFEQMPDNLKEQMEAIK